MLALGIARNDELAAAAGVEVDDGVLVDASMVSSHPRLLAAGDVAFAAQRGRRPPAAGRTLGRGAEHGRGRRPDPRRARRRSWDVAPGFWSAIGKRTLKYAGWGDGWDEVRFEPGDGEGFSACYGRDGELVGVLAHDDDAAYEEGKQAIEERARWQ